MVAVIVSLHVLIRNNHGPDEKFKEKIAEVEREKQSADLRSQLLISEISEYRQSIAAVMPAALEQKRGLRDNPALRELASVAGGAGDPLAIERASGLFEKAKTAFREEDFESSNHLFAALVEKYPESVHTPEAHFLLAEGRFQMKEYADSAAQIEKMIEAYPESELTGFALLRLGRIFEIQDRLEDAGDIYKAILANFKQPALVRQARTSLRAVTL